MNPLILCSNSATVSKSNSNGPCPISKCHSSSASNQNSQAFAQNTPQWLKLKQTVKFQQIPKRIHWGLGNEMKSFYFLFFFSSKLACHVNILFILIKSLDTSVFSIYYLTTNIILTQKWNVDDQINTFERLKTISTQMS